MDAISHGASDGLKVGLNVIAMLIGFIAIIALLDYVLSFIGSSLGSLGLSLSFIGIDIVLSHLEHHPFFLIFFLGINYIFIEVAALRIFSRIFLGPHKKAYHEIAFKSA